MTDVAALEQAASQLDLAVGVLRATWAKGLTAVVAVGDNTVVTYDASHHQLSLVAVRNHCTTRTESNHAGGTAAAAPALNFDYLAVRRLNPSKTPTFSSLHVVEHRREVLLLCIAADRKRFCIVSVYPRVGGDAPAPPTPRYHQSNLPLTPTAPKYFTMIVAGELPCPSSHVVPFLYRGAQYVLCYQTTSGEFCVLAMANICAAAATASTSPNHHTAPSSEQTPHHTAVVTKGLLGVGWTHVTWKGTHHVRCTRQKFFCYNAATGASVFECIWIRHSSTSTSICSREIVQMPATSGPNDTIGDDAAAQSETVLQVNRVLRRTNCIVVPVTLRGRIACLLYSHSSFTTSGGASTSPHVTALSTSTSRMTQLASNGPSPDVAAGAAVLLQKRVFAHADSWSHFCTLRDSTVDGTGDDLLLCYSAQSGAVWVSRVIVCAEGAQPANEVTLYRRLADPDPGLQLTTAALHGLGAVPVDIDGFAADSAKHLDLVDDTEVPSPRALPPRPATAPTRPPLTGGVAVGTRRPGSSGRRAFQKVLSMETMVMSLGYADSIEMIVREIASSEFNDSSAVSEAAIAAVATPGFSESSVRRMADTLERSLALSGSRPSSAAIARGPSVSTPASLRSPSQHGSDDGSGGRSPSPANRHRQEWQSVAGLKTIIQPPRTAASRKYEKQRAAYRTNVIPTLVQSKSTRNRLLREHDMAKYQKDTIDKQIAALRKLDVSEVRAAKGDLPPTSRTVTRLAEMDLTSRKTRHEAIVKKYNPPHPRSKKTWESDTELEDHATRMSEGGVASREASVARIKRQMEAASGVTFSPRICTPPASPGKLPAYDPAATCGGVSPRPLAKPAAEALAKRLVTDSLERRARENHTVFEDMTRGEPPHVALPPAVLEESAKRLSELPPYRKPEKVFRRPGH